MKKLFRLVLILALCALLLGAWTVASGNNGDYNIGGGTVAGTVENLEINWTAGRVIIAYHQEDTILLEETAKGNLSENDRLRWQLKDGTLSVVFNKPALFSFSTPEKELTVTLPEGLRLKSAKIEATSGELVIPALEAEAVYVGTTSGNVDAALKAERVKSSSTAGEIRLVLEGKPARVEAGATSGSVDVKVEQAEEVNLSCTSGPVRLEAEQAGKASVHTTSGNIHVSLGRFDELKISSTSGSVEAALCAEPGFAGSVTTTSGGVSSKLPVMIDGNRYSCGDGSAKLEIGTTSGSVTLLEREKK